MTKLPSKTEKKIVIKTPTPKTNPTSISTPVKKCSVSVFDHQSKKIAEINLNPAIWNTPRHDLLISRAMTTELANARQSSKKTKTRGEVSGGGRKPWRQKGTGRARAGSIRSPIWRGGGITFGPTGKENYSKKMNKKEKQRALLSCLSMLYEANKILVVDLPSIDRPKTKSWLEICAKLHPGYKKGLVLIALDQVHKNWKLSFANLTNHKATSFAHLRICDLIHAEKLILDRPSLDALEARFSVR